MKVDSISFIGGGVMGEAIINGLLSNKLVRPEKITASEPRQDRREELRRKLGVNVTNNNCEAVQSCEIVVFCVKPQVLPRVMMELKGRLRQEQMVISIVAGARISAIKEQLGHSTVVRVMPNMPAQIREGMSVWIAAEEVNQEQLGQAKMLLQTLGKEYQVNDEDFLDIATAVSGTGPTYVFLVMEAVIDAAVHLGCPRHIAYQLTTETMRGSILYAMQSGKHPAELRNMVTTEGGTSAAALYELEKGRLRTVISRAIRAAHERSKTLGSNAEHSSPTKKRT
jgi:pyrroline-5-carboxylate reductase